MARLSIQSLITRHETQIPIYNSKDGNQNELLVTSKRTNTNTKILLANFLWQHPTSVRTSLLDSGIKPTKVSHIGLLIMVCLETLQMY